MMIAAWPADAPRGAVSVFCRRHGVSRSRFYEIRALAARVGPVQAVTARCGPRQRPGLGVAPAVEAAAVRIRKQLADDGWDHGPVSVRARMLTEGLPAPSRATLARIFTRHAMVTPQPNKRPRSSYRRFTFPQVHGCWQLDATETTLADGSTATVFQLLDDHSRYVVASTVDTAETSAGAVAVLRAGIAAHQVPQFLLTDNGTAMNPHRRGWTSALAASAAALGIRAITSRIYHPQTCGKDERIHSTLKRWLAARPPASDLAELAGLVAQFDRGYNHTRPHQGLNMATPADVLATGPRADPPEPAPEPAPMTAQQDRPPTPKATTNGDTSAARVSRADIHKVQVKRVGSTGSVRVLNRHFIGLGIEHAGSQVLVVTEHRTVSVLDAHGTHLRTVELQPDRRYYPTGRPRGGPPRPRLNATIDNTLELSGHPETELSTPN
jgi:transposase InsO family protein